MLLLSDISAHAGGIYNKDKVPQSRVMCSRSWEQFPSFKHMPWQNGRHFADNIFKCIFLKENVWLSIKISLRFVTEVRINNIPVLVQIMVWRRSGDMPLSGSVMVSLPTHICVTRPQWIKHMCRDKMTVILHPTFSMSSSMLKLWYCGSNVIVDCYLWSNHQ